MNIYISSGISRSVRCGMHSLHCSRSSTLTSRDLSVSLQDDLTALSHYQRDELFSGRFPTDFSGEVITLKTTLAEYYRLFDAFDSKQAKCVFTF